MMVSVVIINYNTYLLTADCIRSVIQQTKGIPFEIILVDNDSTECDPGKFLEEFPEIKLVRNKINGGFAKGNNAGIEVTKGDLILLLNSDTRLNEDSITRSATYFSNNEQKAILGCRMTFPDGKTQYTARRFRSLKWELLDLFRFILYLLPYRKRADLMLGKYFRHDINRFCDWVNGAFFLFPKKLLAELPGNRLDERFFMYGEDQLWCEQANRLGYSVFFYAGTTIIHINGGSTNLSRQIVLRKTMMRNELEIMRLRRGKGLYYYSFKAVYVTKEASRNLIKSIVHRLTGRLIR